MQNGIHNCACACRAILRLLLSTHMNEYSLTYRTYTVCQSLTGGLTDWLTSCCLLFEVLHTSFPFVYNTVFLFLNGFLDFQYCKIKDKNKTEEQQHINKKSSNIYSKKFSQFCSWLIHKSTRQVAAKAVSMFICKYIYVEFWCVIQFVRKYETFEVFRFSGFIYRLRQWHIRYVKCFICVI